MAKKGRSVAAESIVNALPAWLQAILRHPLGSLSAFVVGNITLCQLICLIGVRRRAALKARKDRRAIASASSLAKAMGVDPSAGVEGVKASGKAPEAVAVTFIAPSTSTTEAVSVATKPAPGASSGPVGEVSASSGVDVLTEAGAACDASEEACASCKSLADSVKRIDRHVIVCTSGPWDKHVEKSEGAFITALNGAIEAMQTEFGVKIKLKLTACDRPSTVDGLTDVIVYPEKVLIQVPPADVAAIQTLAKVVLGVDPLSGSGLRCQPVPYSRLVLVCCHMTRDKRCGKAGPIVVNELRSVLKAKNVPEKDIAVFPSSHIGGHEFAGTLIVYPESECFGYITKKKCELLVRRMMAASSEDAALLQECLRGTFIPQW